MASDETAQMIEPLNRTAKSERDQLLQCLRKLLLEGLKHGFFDCSIACEIVKNRKRRVTIKAGKSHQFTIREEELQD